MYQVVILDSIGGRGPVLRETLKDHIRELNLNPDTEFEFLDGTQLHQLRPDAARAAVLFSEGPAGKNYATEVQALLDSPAVVIPAVTSLENFSSKVPAQLAATNGLKLDPADAGLEKVAGLILELLGLLRKRRRLFISYKRTESAGVAHQLYHALDERSFDVFLDTLSVRPADQFQEQLWHRMADSDVVVLLYTASIHSSGWVEKEIERASGMKITVFQLIWPGVARDRKTELFEPLYLQLQDFDPAKPEQLLAAKAAEISTRVESLRAGSLARRESELVGVLRDCAAKRKLTTSVQATRCVDVHCDPSTFARVIPAVGVPDSEAFQMGALAPAEGATPKQVVLLYDSMNVASAWRTHLDWLHQYLPVKTVKAFEVDQWLSTLCP